MTGVPEGSFCLSVYDSRSFGWFDMKTFEKFFFFSNIFEIKWKTEWSKSNNSRESTVWLFS